MSFHWGELPQPYENKLNLSPSEREALCNIPRALNLEGPKIHQPTEQATSIKCEPPESDQIVTNTIQLLIYKQQLERLLDTANQYKQALNNGELEQMPHLPPLPSMPPVSTFQRSQDSQSPFGYNFHEETDFTRGVCPNPAPSIGARRARQGLYRAVATLTAHAGYHVANSIALDTLTDAVQMYIATWCNKMRLSLDNELECAPDAGTGFPDVMERVCSEIGVGSVLSLQDYYEDQVVRYHSCVVTTCRELAARYRSELPEWNNTSVPQFGDHDDIPEMHFPSSEEGDGDGLLDHATPQLDAGMQMLQSLEASVELGVGTPMSIESEGMGGSVLSLSVATPSPQVGGRITPSGRTSSPQLPQMGSARKRRRSGKFL